MANDRQDSVVNETRSAARVVDDGLSLIESLQGRYDVLNIETPNFAAGYFGVAREVTPAMLLGVFNSINALKAADLSAWNALRAALREFRN